MIDHPVQSTSLEPVDSLKEAKVNPRTHSEGQLEQLANAIRRFGWTMPIMYDRSVPEIVAGHGRKGAAQIIYAAGESIHLAPGRERGGAELPAGTVPVLDVTGWTEDERRAMLLADNALAEQAGWDYGALGAELRYLEGVSFDMDVVGFAPAMLDDIFSRTADPEPSVDVIPEPPANPVSQAGDLWLLGDHRLLCGDATDKRAVKYLLGDGAADLTLTDPPYGIGYGYRTHDDKDNEANERLVTAAFANGPGSKVWTPGLNNLARDLTRYPQARVAFWHKGFAAAGNGLGGASTVEPVLVIDPPVRKLANNYIHAGTDRAEVDGSNLRDLHPCPKPVELYEKLLRAFSERGHVIFEPFGGSGTTLIACQTTGRACRAVEIDPAYCDVIVKRWQELTGAEATLEGADRSFEEVRIERLGEN